MQAKLVEVFSANRFSGNGLMILTRQVVDSGCERAVPAP